MGQVLETGTGRTAGGGYWRRFLVTTDTLVRNARAVLIDGHGLPRVGQCYYDWSGGPVDLAARCTRILTRRMADPRAWEVLAIWGNTLPENTCTEDDVFLPDGPGVHGRVLAALGEAKRNGVALN